MKMLYVFVGLGIAGGLYLCACVLLLRGDLVPALLFMLAGGACCSRSLFQLRQSQQRREKRAR